MTARRYLIHRSLLLVISRHSARLCDFLFGQPPPQHPHAMDGNPPGASEGYGHPGRPYPISVFDMTTSYKNSQPRVSSTLKPRADGRKKFTTEQTLEMEMLFRENTHPSRDQRLDLAKSFDV